MKTPRFSLPLVVAALALSTPAWPSFVDTFENGVNAGNWDVASGWTDMFYDCGNPGWCFYSSTTDFVPQPKTSLSVPNPFQGNYRAMAVMGVGVDLYTDTLSWGNTLGRPLSVILQSDNGTPANPNDDWGAYAVSSADIPMPGEGWRSFDFAVPSKLLILPPGWTLASFGGAPGSWSALMDNVARVRFFYGNPSQTYPVQSWNLRLDNARLVTATTPGEIGPSSLRADRTSPGSVRLSWSPSPCGAAAQDYGIYMGTLGSWTSNTAVDCHDDPPSYAEDVTTGEGDRYFLVVPFNASYEGSYGADSNGSERQPGTPAVCAAQRSTLQCP